MDIYTLHLQSILPTILKNAITITRRLEREWYDNNIIIFRLTLDTFTFIDKRVGYTRVTLFMIKCLI